jgi:DNA-binding NarL/FixJ family response regulator
VLNLKHHTPNLILIIIADREDKVCLLHLIQAGVVGYLLYSDSLDCWVSCLRAILTDGGYFPRATLVCLGEPDDEVLQLRQLYGLTERECQVLVLLNQGLDNQRIATAMGLTDHTVRNYKCTIKKKMGS